MNNRKTNFLNIDVELRSKLSLHTLCDYLRRFVYMLHEEGHFIAFEVTFDVESLDDLVRKIVGIIDALPQEERASWDHCESRRFDIGIEAGDEPRVATFQLSRDSIKLIASIGGEVAITVYAASAASCEA